jgi:hypothetical protein
VRYVDAYGESPGVEAQIVIPLAVSLRSKPLLVVMDTAAPWCIFESEVAFGLTQSLAPLPGQVALSTRFGIFRGSLYRVEVSLPADEGESLGVDATVFVCPDWPGPSFLGYQGFLQRIRFAVDPESNTFYFGRI